MVCDEYLYYAAVPGAGGDDAIFILGPKDILHEYIQNKFCELVKDRKIAVLPVEINIGEALILK